MQSLMHIIVNDYGMESFDYVSNLKGYLSGMLGDRGSVGYDGEHEIEDGNDIILVRVDVYDDNLADETKLNVNVQAGEDFKTVLKRCKFVVIDRLYAHLDKFENPVNDRFLMHIVIYEQDLADLKYVSKLKNELDCVFAGDYEDDFVVDNEDNNIGYVRVDVYKELPKRPQNQHYTVNVKVDEDPKIVMQRCKNLMVKRFQAHINEIYAKFDKV